MDNEVSSVSKQAVILIVISFVLSISWLTVVFGQQLYRGTNTTITTSMSYVYAAEIESIMDYHQDLPAASIYVALEKNKDAINSISGFAHGVSIYTIEDLQRLFRYQLHCTITRNNETYDIVIGP